MSKRFTPEKVRERLKSYDEQGVESVRSLVASFMEWEVRRAESIDRKAAVVLGYAGVLVGVVLPWLMQRPGAGDPIVLSGYAVALLGASVAVAFAFWGLRARAGWALMGDRALFPRLGETPLRQFHVLAMRLMHEEHLRLGNRKADAVIRAQWALAASAAGILASIGYRLLTLFLG